MRSIYKIAKSTFVSLLFSVFLLACAEEKPPQLKPWYGSGTPVGGEKAASILLEAPDYAKAGSTFEIKVTINNPNLVNQNLVSETEGILIQSSVGCEIVSFGGRPVRLSGLYYEVPSNPDFVLNAQGEFKTTMTARLADYDKIQMIHVFNVSGDKPGIYVEVINGGWARTTATIEVRKP